MSSYPQVIAFSCLLFCTVPAFAEDAVLYSASSGECTLSVEASGQWHTLRLRAHHPSGRNCLIERQAAASVLEEAMLKAAGKYESLSIGRLIDFPWLSQALAEAAGKDKGWNIKKGKPLSKDYNGYVARLLEGMTATFDGPLAKGGYRIKGVSVEKVLVGHYRDVPLYQDINKPGLVPFDAQVWYRLEPLPVTGR